MRDDANGLLARWRLLLRATADAQTSKADVAVLACILDRIGESGTAWPGLSTIAKDASVTRRQAVRSVARLVTLGYIERESGTRTTSNRYAMGRDCVVPRGSDTVVPRGRDGAVTGVGTVLSLGVGTTLSPEPTHMNLPNEPTQEPSSQPAVAHKRDRKKQAAASSRSKRSVELEVIKGMALPASLTRESWHNFVEHREAMQKQKRLTMKAAELSLRKLEGFATEGHDPNEIVDTSIANGWTGLFAPKASGRAPGSLADRVRRSAEDFANYDFNAKSPPRRPAAHTASGPSEAEAARMNDEAERRLAKLRTNSHG